MGRTAGGFLLATIIVGCRGAAPAVVVEDTLPSTLPSSTDSTAPVQAEMRRVDLHVADGIVMHIERLDGALLPARPHPSPLLDDKRSLIVRIRTARIGIDTASLSNLLNREVFGYPGSPIRNIRVVTDGDQLVQTGKLKGFGFRIRSTLSLTPAGEIRLHPTKVKVIGLNVRGLMGFFGIQLQELMTLQPGRGARIDQDDFVLDPTKMLRAPRLEGRLSAITIEPGGVVQTFGAAPPAASTPAAKAAPVNYLYFRGGTLRFGKLTMIGTDLRIVDDDPSNPLDFSLDHYNEQLVAGYSKNTPDHGLVVHVPDYRLVRERSARAKPVRP
jgi:hypothetical protein